MIHPPTQQDLDAGISNKPSPWWRNHTNPPAQPAYEKSTMIHPTIGRRLWYWPSIRDQSGSTQPSEPNNPMTVDDPSQPCDAGVVFVHSDTCVNLTVADHGGRLHARTSVRLIQPEEDRPEDGGFATWMDYQVSNAT